MNLFFTSIANQSVPLPDEVPIVVIHPGMRSVHPFLQRLLSNLNSNPVFVAIENAPTDAMGLCGLLLQALNEQYDCRLPTAADMNACLEALAAFAPYRLFFEAFDLIDESDALPWLRDLMHALPSGCQIIVSGRRLPYGLLHAAEFKAKVAFFPTDPDQMLHDYVRHPSDHVLLEVFGLGTGKALVNGKLIEQWDGMLPYTLFFYMVDRGMATRDEIFQTFWPGLSIREATNVFHVTKRKINELLGFDLTAYWSGFYRIAPTVELHYDVHKFIECIQNSEIADDADAIPLLDRAVHLNRGPFLGKLAVNWAQTRRAELSATYTEALATLAQLHERQRQPDAALGMYVRALNTQPQREDLARSVMALYHAAGQPEHALTVYRRLSDTLQTHANMSPDKRTVQLAEQIQTQRTVIG